MKADNGITKEIKVLIIEALNIEDAKPEDVGDDEPLFGEGNALGLDSIDALEIVMALQEKYGVKIEDKKQAQHILRSVSTIAEFIAANRTA